MTPAVLRLTSNCHLPEMTAVDERNVAKPPLLRTRVILVKRRSQSAWPLMRMSWTNGGPTLPVGRGEFAVAGAGAACCSLVVVTVEPCE